MISVPSTRMSGEMDTSLANGFTNLMLLEFWASEHHTELKCVVEGDDGLSISGGPVPTADWFAKLGFTIKIVITTLERASFCGMVFDYDSEQLVVDPIKTIMKLGWTKARYINRKDSVLLGLLKSKVLSAIHLTPAAPMVGAYCKAIYKLLAAVSVFTDYDPELNYSYRNLTAEELKRPINKLMEQEPTLGTRMCVQAVYGVTVDDQIAFERYCDTITEIIPLSHPVIDNYISLAQRQAWDYVLSDTTAYPCLRVWRKT